MTTSGYYEKLDPETGLRHVTPDVCECLYAPDQILELIEAEKGD